MKNFKTFMAAALLCTCQSSMAQSIGAYSVTPTNGTYTELSGATVIPIEEKGSEFKGLAISGDGEANYTEFTAAGFPIGFEFEFDGQKMTQFIPCTSGYLLLGASEISWSANSNQFAIFDNGIDKDLFGLTYIGDVYGLDNTEISYKLEGEAPNRVLAVQYKNLGIPNRWGDFVVDTVQIQLRLHEGTNNLSMTLNGFQPSSDENTNYCSFKIGILGSGKDRLMLANYEGTATTTSDKLLAWRTYSYPQDGITYTFKAPEPCVTPEAQPTDLQLSATSTSVSGSFTACEADNYLVLATTDATLSDIPADGVTYNKGDTIGNARVAAIVEKPNTSFSTGEEYYTSTTYNFFVIAYNSKCLGGPLYNNNNPLTATVTTQAGAPEALEVTASDFTTMTLSAKAVEGTKVMIVYSDSIATTRWGQVISGGVFGTPAGTYNVGDAVDGGGIVAYIGDSNDNIQLSNLKEGKLYNFRAWSTDGNGNYSSYYLTDAAYTTARLPWTAEGMNLDGWTCIDEKNWTTNVRTGNFENKIYEITDEENGLVQTLTTPAIQLSEKENRLFSDIYMTVYEYWSNSAYTLKDGDTLRIEVTDDGKTFETIAEYTKDNLSQFGADTNPSKFEWTFSQKAGKVVNFRFYLRSHAATTLCMTNIHVIEKPEVDYPLNVVATDIIADTAVIAWKPQGSEREWQVSYKLDNDEAEWSDPLTATDSTYTLTGLESTKAYLVRVRTVGANDKYSDWTEGSFTSGLCVPFKIDFTTLEESPSTWMAYEGALTDSTTLYGSSCFYWRQRRGVGTMSYYTYQETASDWLVSPLLAVSKDKKYTYTIDITTTEASPYATASTDNELILLVSHDGENFKPSDSILVVGPEKYVANTENLVFSAPFDGFDGRTHLALLVHSTNGAPIMFTVNSIELTEEAATGIQTINTTGDAAQPQAIYNANGQQLPSLQRGINIVKMKDGSTKKVIIK